MKKLVIFLLSVLLISLTGCGGEMLQTGSEASAREAVTKQENAIVVYAGTTMFDNGLNPVKGAMSHGYSFINAALVKVMPDGSYGGDMAESWVISEDAMTYTFKLREDVMFSNGTELTAEDVVFTYETVKENQAENEAVDLTRLVDANVLSDYEVQFRLSEPFSPFLDTTAQLGIVPRTQYDAERFDRVPIGTGPWQVIQYDANQQIIVEPNPYYYEGAPAIDRVTFVYMDSDSALSATRSGQLDVVMVSPDYALETVEGMTMYPMETMDIRQVSLPVQPAHENREGLIIGNDVTCDKSVRKALAIGINREAIIQNALNGIGKPANGFTNNLVWAGAITYEDNRKAEAIALLEADGWMDSDGDGIREKNGLKCAFDLYAAEDRYALAAALAEEASALGIRIDPHFAGWDDISKNQRTSAVLWGWGQYSPTVLTSLFYSKSIFTGSYDNVVSYVNPEADLLIEKATSAANQEDAMESWRLLQELTAEDNAYLYLVNIEHCYFIRNGLDLSDETQIPHPHGHGSPVICNMKDWTLMQTE